MNYSFHDTSMRNTILNSYQLFCASFCTHIHRPTSRNHSRKKTTTKSHPRLECWHDATTSYAVPNPLGQWRVCSSSLWQMTCIPVIAQIHVSQIQPADAPACTQLQLILACTQLDQQPPWLRRGYCWTGHAQLASDGNSATVQAVNCEAVHFTLIVNTCVTRAPLCG